MSSDRPLPSPLSLHLISSTSLTLPSIHTRLHAFLSLPNPSTSVTQRTQLGRLLDSVGLELGVLGVGEEGERERERRGVEKEERRRRREEERPERERRAQRKKDAADKQLEYLRKQVGEDAEMGRIETSYGRVFVVDPTKLKKRTEEEKEVRKVKKMKKAARGEGELTRSGEEEGEGMRDTAQDGDIAAAGGTMDVDME